MIYSAPKRHQCPKNQESHRMKVNRTNLLNSILTGLVVYCLFDKASLHGYFRLEIHHHHLTVLVLLFRFNKCFHVYYLHFLWKFDSFQKKGKVQKVETVSSLCLIRAELHDLYLFLNCIFTKAYGTLPHFFVSSFKSLIIKLGGHMFEYIKSVNLKLSL